ncbi:MAG: DUF115 domain-containing protein [Candidatus Nitrohelix vancouverensis]|uniref:DUF115 domain-containing protein n=1 Tax=Candidatus Nitrohelix vancouverensis TaxID=2705534 RepID=A0A7T0C225_9BACT|nr:MAG: DUF115 domain-containing protein [Candidatus Nitrohelix vancouverensis]
MIRDRHIHEVKQATSLRFSELWKRNFNSNKNAILRNQGVAALRDRFKGTPSIVVGAGPSLDKNIALLQRSADKALIISSDAALKPLLRRGVKPSVVVCLDPQEEISKFFKGTPSRNMLLVAPSIVHPRALDCWEGSVVFYNKHAPDIPVLTEIQRLIPNIGVLTPGGTVLSVAYDLAFQSGSNPIIFVGQDLSWTTPKTHSRNSEMEDNDFTETLHRQKDNIVNETDLFGRTRPTLKCMSVSKEWFYWAFSNWNRKQPTRILNCSESGILMEHCTVMPLREALNQYCRKTINVAWTLKKALK